MCQTCGCGDRESSVNGDLKQINVVQEILHKNTQLAQQNRAYFKSKGVLVLNILSSPGSGKTALIERMLQCSQFRIGAIVGDLETDNDAKRLRSHGVPAVQITTGNICHLEADMIARASKKLNLDALDLLIIENVGNLVCPAAYDLGEDVRIVLLSVTEGEDKPLKYPTLFKTAQVAIVNKIDLAQAVEFNREQAIANIERIAPHATIFAVSAKTGQGMEDWYTYLEQKYRGIGNASFQVKRSSL
ncbi:hydrogenase nickel incorporation protein HypB [Gloeocapsopsis crepidinum LEGE 06123]|uniref:Hydrogenase nickel incorporation protein HypB n=1 Tax=Gloeocapsopsis crepidinum LEGE 06123 TaxID=588587 RepID=A0ABR9UNC7_9CHRO|nr:hydrogenase nickel incorporation protein HypB [Gloeocapsopsis crepidinum]MBE9189786.1 hydrogenase nickel incorporation protein HypB [Gloeocapsopsis crepidinum LEGE 06123]